MSQTKKRDGSPLLRCFFGGTLALRLRGVSGRRKRLRNTHRTTVGECLDPPAGTNDIGSYSVAEGCPGATEYTLN